mgnify:FL=1
MSKIKVLVLGDHPLSPSGVGIQTKYICEGMLKTGRFSIISLGGAVKHHKYDPIMVDPWNEDFKIIPIDGYGTPDMIRSIVRTERIDMIWLMTDPRFWGWLWQIENELRPLVPMVYYHVWDNFPAPFFNRKYYLSNDVIVTISKVTDKIVKEVAPEVKSIYLPHSVDTGIFKPLPENEITRIKNATYAQYEDDDPTKFTFFWNNRNARRKQSGTLIYWFKDFLDQVGHDKARLVMHTDPQDSHGQDLVQIIDHLDLDNGQVLLSTKKLSPQDLAAIYNMADCTVNISDAEGFGLSTLESLACGVPIIVNMTGGLQEQVTNGQDWFGFGVFPASKAIIGSQEVPYIYEDRISKEHFISSLKKMISLSKEDRKEMGLAGRQHILENYNFENYKTKWAEIMLNVYETHGSWENRKGHNKINFLEVA